MDGTEPFVFVNVWAQKARSYEAFALEALRALHSSLTPGTKMVVVGDFNSTPLSTRYRKAHENLMTAMRDEFSLVSAYHAHHRVPTGGEAHPTHYWLRRKTSRPFHIDYVFVPLDWEGRIRSVEVGAYESWRDSDHCPVVVEID